MESTSCDTIDPELREKIKDLILSGEKANRRIALGILNTQGIPQILSFIRHFAELVLKNHPDQTGDHLRMILYSMLFIRKGYGYHMPGHTAQALIDTCSDNSLAIEKKEGVWLGLEDLEKIGCSRDSIEHYGIESSIDEWETVYNNGSL